MSKFTISNHHVPRERRDIERIALILNDHGAGSGMPGNAVFDIKFSGDSTVYNIYHSSIATPHYSDRTHAYVIDCMHWSIPRHVDDDRTCYYIATVRRTQKLNCKPIRKVDAFSDLTIVRKN